MDKFRTTSTAPLPICLPLDGITRQEALALAERLAGQIWGFKVNDLLASEGAGILTTLKKYGNVFADAKLHDIPNTVANSVKVYVDAGADIITVHASGGPKMVAQAVEAAPGVTIAAVTILTSLSPEMAQMIYGKQLEDCFMQLARVSVEAGAQAIVCSPKELERISTSPLFADTFVITPGIRPRWHGGADDQKRTMPPADALEAGSSLLVIGRPITQAPDPLEAVNRIRVELGAA